MALLNPPLHLQNRTDHTAQGDRLLIKSIYGVGGIGQTGHLVVAAQAAPNMSVTVAAGIAIISGSENINQGMYHCFNDAPVTVTIAASDAALPRKDLIVAKVQDQSYSGAVNAWSIVAVTGTPNSVPAAPSAPANSITLATITVAAAVTTVQNANIVNNATVARMGETKFQASDPADTFDFLTSAGQVIGSLDPTGHFRSFGTTGGVTKGRKPFCKMLWVGAGSIPSGGAGFKVQYTNAMISMDTDSMFNAANFWIVINTAGMYKVSARVAFTSAAGGYRATSIVKNNTTDLARDSDDAPATVGLQAPRFVSIYVNCVPGDTFYQNTYQNSGASLTFDTAGQSEGTYLCAEWICPSS